MYLRTRSLIVVLFAAFGACMQASGQQNNCTADPTAASCGLDSTAHILRIAAVILGIVLIVILIAAVAIYHRNKNRELTPDD